MEHAGHGNRSIIEGDHIGLVARALGARLGNGNEFRLLNSKAPLPE